MQATAPSVNYLTELLASVWVRQTSHVLSRLSAVLSINIGDVSSSITGGNSLTVTGGGALSLFSLGT
jgi:hypothetical protein